MNWKFASWVAIAVGGCALAASSATAVDVKLPSGEFTYEAAGGDIDFKARKSTLSDIRIKFGEWTVSADKGQMELPDEASGEANLVGAVKLRGPGSELDADAGLIKYQDKRITFIRLTGRPVTFKQKVEGKQQVIDGRANTAEYDISGSIRLVGNAFVSTDEVQITNASIVYDLNEQRVRADNIQDSGDKVRIRIDPKKMNR